MSYAIWQRNLFVVAGADDMANYERARPAAARCSTTSRACSSCSTTRICARCCCSAAARPRAPRASSWTRSRRITPACRPLSKLDSAGPPSIVTALPAVEGARSSKMRFKINEIGDGGLPVNVSVTTEWLASACPDLDARPGRGWADVQGQITPTGDDYLLRGELVGDLETPCARCLEPARVHVDVPIDAHVRRRRHRRRRRRRGRDPDVVTFTGGELDLSGELRDELVLAIRSIPLCDEGCRGLCPLCGGNRNLVPCTHARRDAGDARRPGRAGQDQALTPPRQ